MELLIGALLSSLLLTGIVQLVSSSVSTYRLQLNQSQLEESGRYARDVLIEHIGQAGYRPEPWQSASDLPALTAESLDSASATGDQLGLQRWSRRNCYGSENPVTDDSGRPAFHLLQARFRINSRDNLALTCRYGPNAGHLTTQVRNLGLVEDVESMQVLYAEDRDGDELADSWVTAQSWTHEHSVRAVKVALLLATKQAFSATGNEQLTLLDETLTSPADGRLRRVSSFTAAIRSRLVRQ